VARLAVTAWKNVLRVPPAIEAAKCFNVGHNHSPANKNQERIMIFP